MIMDKTVLHNNPRTMPRRPTPSRNTAACGVPCPVCLRRFMWVLVVCTESGVRTGARLSALVAYALGACLG